MAFEFGMNLTGTFAAQLTPINVGLADTVPLLDKVKVGADGVDAAMSKTSATLKKVKIELEGVIKSASAVEVDWSKALGVDHQVSAFGKAADAASPKVKRFHVELGNMFHSFAGLRYEKDRGFVFNLAEGLNLVSDSIASVTSKLADLALRGVAAFIDLGKHAARVAGDTQDLDLAMELNLGKAGAAAVDQLAAGFERTTRFDKDAIKNALLPLTEQGIKDTKLLDDLATASVDIATRRKQGIDGVNTALESFGKIALKGEVDERALRQLAVGKVDYFTDLAKLLHVSVKEAEDLTKKGKVAKETLLSVVLHQVAARQGGALGIASLAGGSTLGATLQRLSDLPDNLFQNLAHSRGMAEVQRVLDNVIDLLSGPDGLRLVNQLGATIEDVFKDIRPEDIKNVFEAIEKSAELVVKSLGAAVDLVRELSKWADESNARDAGDVAVRDLGGGRKLHIDQIDIDNAVKSKGFNWFERFIIPEGDQRKIGLAEIDRQAREGGLQYAQGFAAGINDGKPLVASAAKDLAATPTSCIRDEAEIHSPSRVAMELGANYGAGYAIGLEDSVDRVANASRAITRASAVGAASDSAGAPLGFASPGARIEIVNHFSFGGEVSPDDAQRLADEIDPRVEQAVRRALRRVERELGEDG